MLECLVHKAEDEEEGYKRTYHATWLTHCGLSRTLDNNLTDKNDLLRK